MIKIHVTVTGDKETIGQLKQAKTILSDFRAEMQSIGDMLLPTFKGKNAPVFASRGSVIGESWQDLSSPYRLYKAIRFSGRPILVRTGAMAEAYDVRATNDSVTIRNTASYAHWHQHGSPGGKIPQRTFLAIGHRQEVDIKADFKQHLLARLRTVFV